MGRESLKLSVFRVTHRFALPEFSPSMLCVAVLSWFVFLISVNLFPKHWRLETCVSASVVVKFAWGAIRMIAQLSSHPETPVWTGGGRPARGATIMNAVISTTRQLDRKAKIYWRIRTNLCLVIQVWRRPENRCVINVTIIHSIYLQQTFSYSNESHGQNVPRADAGPQRALTNSAPP